jgi:hypothetical protein
VPCRAKDQQHIKNKQYPMFQAHNHQCVAFVYIAEGRRRLRSIIGAASLSCLYHRRHRDDARFPQRVV